MSPLHTLDISTAGAAVPADPDAPLPARGYRWVHWSLESEGRTAWCEAHLPPLAAQALQQVETRPRVLVVGDGMILTLRGVNLNPGADPEDMVSVRVWLQQGLIVTLRGRRVYTTDALAEEAREGRAPGTPAGLLARLADRLVARIEELSLDLEDQVDELEDRLYDGDTDTDPDAPEMARMRRSAIRLRRYVVPMALALQDAASSGVPALDDDARTALRETANRATRSVEELDAARDRLHALADHVDMQQAARRNRQGYVLSVIAAIFLPLTFLTGLFGANVAGIPGFNWPGAFAALTATSVLIAVALALLLRWMRWF